MDGYYRTSVGGRTGVLCKIKAEGGKNQMKLGFIGTGNMAGAIMGLSLIHI